MPLLKMKQALNKVERGTAIELLATDAASWRDVHSFTELSAHRLLSAEEQDGVYRYVVEKG